MLYGCYIRVDAVFRLVHFVDVYVCAIAVIVPKTHTGTIVFLFTFPLPSSSLSSPWRTIQHELMAHFSQGLIRIMCACLVGNFELRLCSARAERRRPLRNQDRRAPVNR